MPSLGMCWPVCYPKRPLVSSVAIPCTTVVKRLEFGGFRQGNDGSPKWRTPQLPPSFFDARLYIPVNHMLKFDLQLFDGLRRKHLALVIPRNYAKALGNSITKFYRSEANGSHSVMTLKSGSNTLAVEIAGVITNAKGILCSGGY